MDPGKGNSGQTLQYFWPAFDGLTWMDDAGKLQPGLAKDWKNPDPTTWQFTLGDYKFHNGRAVEAQDVVDSYARYRDPQKKLSTAAAFVSVDKIEAPDTRTIKVTTKAPDPTLPNILSLAMVLPMKEVTQQGEDAFFAKPIGTGPYQVQQADWNTALKFSAVGGGFVSPRGAPAVQDIEVRFLPDAAARTAALQAGDVDAISPVTADAAATLEKAGFKTAETPGTSTVHFLLDPNNGPTKDLRVRQAINYALDKQGIVQQLYGGKARVDGQLIGPGCLGYNADLKPYAYDVAKAKQLLSDAGFSNGMTLPLTVLTISSGGKDIGQVVAAQLAQVGIKTDMKVEEPALWLTEYYGPADKRTGLWVEFINWDQTYEPNSVWRWYTSDLPSNAGRRWEDATFDKMYQQAKTTFDRDKRGQMYQEAGKYLFDQAPVLFLWQNYTLGSMKKNITWTPGLFADAYVGKLKVG